MYQEQLSSSKPGLIVIMIDQSGSMVDPYAGSTKAKFAALAVNRVIAEIITACTVGDEIRDRCYVAVIGYGSGVNVMFLDKVSDLSKNSNTINVKKKVSDNAGGLVEVDEVVRVFVKDTANGGTPMTEAFREAYKGVEKFISNNPNSFPPIAINITDGQPDSIDTAAVEANKLAQLKTSDGNVVIMNAHISDASAGRIELPSNNAGFSGDKFANFLYDISSVLPETLSNRAKEVGFNVGSGSRGFAFNADAETLIRILNFGSLGALR
jgi:hypothetical protein